MGGPTQRQPFSFARQEASVTAPVRFGLIRPALDAHTLGLNAVARLLRDQGVVVVAADPELCEAANQPCYPGCAHAIERWVRAHGITHLGFSFRLEPATGVALFDAFLSQLKARRLLLSQDGPLRGLYFAGQPEACRGVACHHPEVNATFCGEETENETLRRLGYPCSGRTDEATAGRQYDRDRLAFGRELVARGHYEQLPAPNHLGYDTCGTEYDTLPARLAACRARGSLPVTRAHLGVYRANREEGIRLFHEWCRELGRSELLDVLSVGTSQLSQSRFSEPCRGLSDGGGVPLQTAAELVATAMAARPMLVRAYAGSRNVLLLAKLQEQYLNTAWHALAFWWFCQLDGRGENAVRDNLIQHVAAVRWIAGTGKPFEANVGHHFAFHGADDVTQIVATVLAARTAKTLGVRHFVLQNMLCTPQQTWGIQDLAKARVLLHLVRALQDSRFEVIYQPRCGSAHLSHDLNLARAQLAAATALMDDVEPLDPASPPVVHVASYSDGAHLPTPMTVQESVRITLQALKDYRALKKRGEVPDMGRHSEVGTRTAALLDGCHARLRAIGEAVPDTCSAEGLYAVLREGFLPVPQLWCCRDEFAKAVDCDTRLIDGGVSLVSTRSA